MTFIMRRILPVFLAVLISLPAITFSGCEDQQSVISACEEYLSALSEGNYGACYGMLADGVTEAVSQSDFIDRHDRIYSAIRRTDTEWSFHSAEQLDFGSAYAIYDLTFSSEILEKFTVRITMPLVYERLEWRVDWSPALIFPQMEWEDQLIVSTIWPKRGEILDSNANQYAVNDYADTVFINVSTVEDVLSTSTALASLLRMDAAQIRASVAEAEKKGRDIAVIKTYLPDTVDATLTQLLTAIQGVGVDHSTFTPMRFYPQMDMSAHLIGYTSPVSAETLPNLDPFRYNADSRVGATGLERTYENELTGYRGYDISVVRPNGEKISVVRQDATDGYDLELTIDKDLQQRAYGLLSMLEEDQAGVIIAIDPITGDLLASASWPAYDPNLFSFPITDYEERFNDPAKRQPLFPRMTQGMYPPGSTVKPLVAAFALESGIVSTGFEFTQEIDRKNKQWTPTAYGEWFYPPITRVDNYSGPMNLQNAIIESDNIFFAYLALQAGWSRLLPFYESAGFGESIPFDMSVAKPNIMSPGEEVNLHQLASSGFGQGKMLVSPLQISYIFSLFANNGSIMKPRLVKALRRMDNDGMQYDTVREFAPAVWKKDVLKQSTVDTIYPMLRKVITEGSGRPGRLQDIVTLGKTGTAELDDNKQREIAWSISFVESDDYSRLVCVMLEVPSNQGSYRHTCVREMLLP